MLNKIYKIVKYVKNPKRYNSKNFTKYLIKKGVKIGKGTYFFAPENTFIDTENGYFIEIGEYCKITTGVRILAHDYSYSVLRRVYHTIPKKAALTVIGDNVFVGVNSIILCGSKIGNNVIIGAGSTVSGSIPSNQVWGGNPAKFICTLEEYYEKCKKNYEDNCSLTIQRYIDRAGRLPTIQELQYFSLLFLNNDVTVDKKRIISAMSFNGDEKEEVIEDCLSYKSKYKNYEDLIEKLGIKYKRRLT